MYVVLQGCEYVGVSMHTMETSEFELYGNALKLPIKRVFELHRDL